MKKRRATVIIETEKGIMLTKMYERNRWLLPGGHAEINEPRIIAAIRELYEETRLSAREVKFLFDFESNHYYHKVFLIQADGEPVNTYEVRHYEYYNPSCPINIANIHYSSMNIINKYYEMKSGS